MEEWKGSFYMQKGSVKKVEWAEGEEDKMARRRFRQTQMKASMQQLPD